MSMIGREPIARETIADDFVTQRDALRLTGWSRERFEAIRDAGFVSIYQLPGAPRRYSRRDLLRVMREALRPATARLAGKSK